MSNCPICNTALNAPVCPACGYDRSRDYEAFPTFAPVPAVNIYHQENLLCCPSCNCRNFLFLAAKSSLICSRCGHKLSSKPQSDFTPQSSITTIAAGSNYTAALYSDGTVRLCGISPDIEWLEPRWEHICAIYPGRNCLYGRNTDGLMLHLPLDKIHHRDLHFLECHIRQLKTSNCIIHFESQHPLPYYSSNQNLTVVADGEDHVLGLLSNGTTFTDGNQGYLRCQTSHWSNIISIAASSEHSFGLNQLGTVYSAGDLRRKISRVQSWNNITALTAGTDHIVGLHKDGTVIAAGSNDLNQLCVQGWYDIIAIAAGYFHTVGLRKNGSVIATGDSFYGACNVRDWCNIASIAAGGYHTVGLRSDGTLVAVGNNHSGQCNVQKLMR